jgi:hypothetical protein
MRHWVGILATEQFAMERLYARESITLPAGAGEGQGAAEPDDAVALVTAGPASALFGLGVVVGRSAAGAVRVAYRERLYDDPPTVPAQLMPAARPVPPGLYPLPPSQYTLLSALAANQVQALSGHSVWFVSVALPIEAATRADAVREFWTYVDKLGPQELPAYVWPLGDELAMQAYVLGAVTNLDPEKDED